MVTIIEVPARAFQPHAVLRSVRVTFPEAVVRPGEMPRGLGTPEITEG
jgi:hypothetical protein